MSNPSKGKEIELKPCPFCSNNGLTIYFTTCPSDTTEIHSVKCRKCVSYGPEKGTERLAIKAWNTRQSPQINIDELALVVQIELVDLLPKNTDPLKVIETCNTANLIAQAITSHLNGKGDN